MQVLPFALNSRPFNARPINTRGALLAAALTACAAFFGYAAASAEATMFIGGGGSYIQAAPTAGGKVKNRVKSRGDGIADIAVRGRYLYWTNNAGLNNVGVINRSTTMGRDFKAKLVKDVNSASALEATGRNLYFALSATIGSSSLSGSAANLNLLAVPNTPLSIAVYGSYIYWSNAANGAIGRANLDGSSPYPDFIPAVPGGVNNVDVGAGYIWWSNAGGTAIGRANLDGSNVNPSFVTGMAQVGDVDVFGNFLYWTNAGGQIGPCDGPGCIPSSPGATAGSIDRAKVNGTGMKHIAKRLNNPNALAVNADPKRKRR